MKLRWLTLLPAVLLVCGAAAISLVILRSGQPGQPYIVSGKALIGGPFTLTDHTGKRVSEKDFEGKFTLVYFGYTFCPDICPAELQVMSAALDQLGGKAKNVTPLFITVDPERDGVKLLAGYVSNFHERLVGLTGSEEDIRAAAKAYRVYYARVKDESSSADYMMDHSSAVYLMGPKGKYLAHFAYGSGVDKMAEGIAKFL